MQGVGWPAALAGDRQGEATSTADPLASILQKPDLISPDAMPYLVAVGRLVYGGEQRRLPGVLL